MRKPRVENRYNLRFSDIRNLVIVDRLKICEPLFWRNNVINAWCINREVGSENDIKFGTNNEFWIGIYDEPKDGYYINCYCCAWGGMTWYRFDKFYQPSDIEHENDLKTQELLLEKINELIDKGILALPERKK